MSAENKNGGGDAAWGCKAIAETIERNERQTYRILPTLLRDGIVTKVGNQYVGSKKRLRQRIFGEVRDA
jgi:hypothetical protein